MTRSKSGRPSRRILRSNFLHPSLRIPPNKKTTSHDVAPLLLGIAKLSVPVSLLFSLPNIVFSIHSPTLPCQDPVPALGLHSVYTIILGSVPAPLGSPAVVRGRICGPD